jgi:hypothetical protein
LNSVTQSTHFTRSSSVLIAAAQAGPPCGTVTAGHVVGKPIEAGLKTCDVHVMPSVEPVPQALQIAVTFFDSALTIAGPALPSPGTGHGREPLALSTALRHLVSDFSFACRNFVVVLPIVL